MMRFAVEGASIVGAWGSTSHAHSGFGRWSSQQCPMGRSTATDVGMFAEKKKSAAHGAAIKLRLMSGWLDGLINQHAGDRAS
jgi:hypothetical protein